MTIPDYQTAMRPALECLADGQAHSAASVRDHVAGVFDTTDEERRELVPSGKKGLFADRVSWALTYMKKAGLPESPKRGFYVLTARGEQVLRDHPTRIDNTVLDEFPDFGSWRERSAAGRPKKPPSSGEESEETPEEQLDSAYLELRATIEAEILDQVRSMSPEFFERLVVGLLVSMGYGGSLRDAGRAIGRSGDGGIDGVINEDQLGLDVIYVQAKRWQNTVGRPEIQSFAGSLDGVKAKKGIFIRTSSFSREAEDYTSRIDKRIVLIDGERLARLMYDHGVGVTLVETFLVRRLDLDYFIEE
ncbi:MAG: restriction endonuclease [Gemmatimonadetes bacterium]|nr:restriction endonuclease [Gemmatimonadota bacterium]